MDYLCLKDCNTNGLDIDPTIFIDKIFYFEKGKLYTIYGELKDTKAVYNEKLDTDNYDAKFIGWVNRKFVLDNFLDEETLRIELNNLNNLFIQHMDLKIKEDVEII
jgi:hypothetical protein